MSGAVINLDSYNAVHESTLQNKDPGNPNKEILETDIQISLLRSRLDDAEKELTLLESDNSGSLKSQRQNSEEDSIPNILCLRRVNFECKPGEFVAVGKVSISLSFFKSKLLETLPHMF